MVSLIDLSQRAKSADDNYGSVPPESYRQILDVLPVGVVLLEPGGGRRVLFANTQAMEIFQRQDGIRVSRAGLGLGRKGEDLQLSAALEAIAKGESAGADSFSITSVLLRAQKSSYVITISQVDGSKALNRRGTPVLCIHEMGLTQAPDALALRKIWKLTPAEAKLAIALMERGNLKDAARMCLITAGTARQYLKRIFTKMEVRGQVELLTRLLRTPPELPKKL